MRRSERAAPPPARGGPDLRVDAIVCELSRRGKLLVGEPFFEPGPPLVLDRRGVSDASPGDLLVVTTPRIGRARVQAVLGPSDQVEVVLDGLLYARGVRLPGGRAPAAVAEAEQLPSDPAGPEPGRVDLRDLLAFTIDPDEAKDFDDAISIRVDGTGVRVWVHIADVTRYLGPGGALDTDAAERTLSVYVPGTVEPMLPERLSNGLCSLVPGRDRLCVTVEIPFDGRLEAGEPVFYRSAIRSAARLTYSQVERVLEGEERIDTGIGEALALAQRLTQELRRRRFARGALQIETGEASFVFDGAGEVERAWIAGEPVAHALVEELMILANEAVGGLLAGRRRDALYRVHERPDPQAIELLLSRLTVLEVPTPPVPEFLTPSEAAGLAAAASVRVRDFVEQSGRGREAFPSMILRSLKQARYDPRNLGHTGLASPAYCHFTSPIRRYPDVVCHRALLAELGVDDAQLPADLEAIAERCSVREREAAKIEHAADDICLAWLLDRELLDLGWDASFDGEIVGAIGSGLFVRFAGLYEGYLPARRLVGDYFELDPLATALVGRRTGHRYRLGDGIAVRVERIERAQGKVELSPAPERPQGRGGRSEKRRT